MNVSTFPRSSDETSRTACRNVLCSWMAFANCPALTCSSRCCMRTTSTATTRRLRPTSKWEGRLSRTPRGLGDNGFLCLDFRRLWWRMAVGRRAPAGGVTGAAWPDFQLARLLVAQEPFNLFFMYFLFINVVLIFVYLLFIYHFRVLFIYLLCILHFYVYF